MASQGSDERDVGGMGDGIVVTIKSSLGRRLPEKHRVISMNVRTLGELLKELEREFSIRLVAKPRSCFVVCDEDGTPVVLERFSNGIELLDAIDVHIWRDGEEICIGQDEAFEFVAGEDVRVHAPAGC